MSKFIVLILTFLVLRFSAGAGIVLCQHPGDGAVHTKYISTECAEACGSASTEAAAIHQLTDASSCVDTPINDLAQKTSAAHDEIHVSGPSLTGELIWWRPVPPRAFSIRSWEHPPATAPPPLVGDGLALRL